VVAQLSHRFGLSAYAVEPGTVEALGLDDRDGNIAVEPGVASEEDSFLGSLAEKTPKLVATFGE
jgi:hypothetical protein